MGINLKIAITIDSSDLGCLTRLMEDGTVKKMTIISSEDAAPDAREFVKTIRDNGGHTLPILRKPKMNGIRAVECVISIMQRKPDAPWLTSEIGKLLSAEFEYSGLSVHSAISTLVKYGYIVRDQNGWIVLTDKGREHPQKETLPFVLGRA